MIGVVNIRSFHFFRGKNLKSVHVLLLRVDECSSNSYKGLVVLFCSFVRKSLEIFSGSIYFLAVSLDF